MLRSSSLQRRERVIVIALAVICLGLRALALLRYRFDSDEPQHLHVAWGWTEGLVQYRDVFDNHTPLFHLLTAPILAMVGERADILIWMRLAMLALWAAANVLTWFIARRIVPARDAVWSLVVLNALPPFLLKSLEYRNDNLWTVFSLAAVLSMLARRPWLTGLLLGAGLATSMKTSLVIISAAVAGLLHAWLLGRSYRPLFSAAAKTAISILPIPLLTILFFHSKGALAAMHYCIIEFNGALAKLRPDAAAARLFYPILLALVAALAWRYARGREVDHTRFFLVLFAAIYITTAACFWILLTLRDFLPLMPLVAITISAALSGRPRALAASVVIMLLSLYYYADRLENRTDEHITMMRQVLGVSRSGEPLIDYKGETIYRRRPYYPALEAITRAQLREGMIADTIAEDVVRSRCYVAQADGPFWPPRAKQFLLANFINLGRLRVAGQWLPDDGRFTIAIPGEYVVVSEHGAAAGVLDGAPYSGPRALVAGIHQFERATPEARIAFVWAPAIQRGYSPFHHRDLDF